VRFWKDKYESLHRSLHDTPPAQAQWQHEKQTRVENAILRLSLLCKDASLSAEEHAILAAAKAEDERIIEAVRAANGFLPAVYSVAWNDICNSMVRIDLVSFDVGGGPDKCRVSNYRSGNPGKDPPYVRVAHARPPVTHVALRFSLEPYPADAGQHSHDADHLCHNCLCHKFAHIIIGPRHINLDRINCVGSTAGCGHVSECTEPVYCRHVPACLHPTSIGHKRRGDALVRTSGVKRSK